MNKKGYWKCAKCVICGRDKDELFAVGEWLFLDVDTETWLCSVCEAEEITVIDGEGNAQRDQEPTKVASGIRDPEGTC